MLQMQIMLIVDENRMEEVLHVLHQDETSALKAKDVFSEFHITKNKNKIQINAVCESMDVLSEHMTQTHYKWKELKDNGAIISQSHRFINL